MSKAVLLWLGTFLVVAIVLSPRAGAAQDSVLDEILEIMRQKGQITEEQQKSLIERAKKERSGIEAGVESSRPFLRSRDDAFRLNIGGRLMTDYHATEDGARLLTGAELADRFLVRRARLELDGNIFRWIGFALSGEFTEGVSLKDAYLDFRLLPGLEVRSGQFKVPFSREELISSRFIDFVERSLVNELAPSRDAGIVLQGSVLDRAVSYAIGVFNGTGEDTADNNSEKEVAGRLVLAPFRPGGNYFLKGLEIAGNFTWGDNDGSTSSQGRTNARTGNRFRFFAPHSTRGERTRWGGDLAWAIGPASVSFEYARQIDERKKVGLGGADLDEVTATAWHVYATFLLTGEDKALGGPITPKRPFSPIAGRFGPGAWELAVRYAELDFKSDSPLDFFDGNIGNGITGGGTTAENGARALTAGVNWYMNRQTRVMFNWTQYWYDKDRGTPFSCQQTVCGAGNLQRTGDTSWEMLARLQIWF